MNGFYKKQPFSFLMILIIFFYLCWPPIPSGMAAEESSEMSGVLQGDEDMNTIYNRTSAICFDDANMYLLIS